MTLAELTQAMVDRFTAAPASTAMPRRLGFCDALLDYGNDCRNILKCGPEDQAHQSARVSDYFADYWMAVADGVSPHYNTTTGARLRERF